MAIIHKIVEGGEQYLGWALQRERVMRKQGGSRSIKYDLGDAEVEIRVVGNQSFVSLRRTGAANKGFEWIAYPCKIAPVVFESAAHATTPVEDGPIVEKLPFVPIPYIPIPNPVFGESPPTCKWYRDQSETDNEWFNSDRYACFKEHQAYETRQYNFGVEAEAAKEAARAQNRAIDLQNNTRLQIWMGENDAPMVAKKNVECDAWDAPKRPGRKAFMETLFTKVLAEVEAGFTTKWLTKVVLSPDYLPVGPFAPTYFIRIVSSSASFDALEQRTDTFTYSITDPDGKERRVEGSKRDIGSYGPATDCFLLNGDEYQSPFRIYELSNFWLGDPADDMRDMLPSSTSRGRGYLVTGSTPTRQDNKFLYADLNEITLPEAVAFDSSPAPAPPHITSDGRRMLDMGFVDGCSVSIIVLRYMMWDAVSNARVPVVGYTETRSRFWCRQGNCLDSNFVSRSSPRNAANEVWLESVVTMTKTNSQWSAPVVTKHPGVFLCPIAVDNTPTKRPGGDLPGDVPYANFPDFVVVVRGMPASYGPAVNELATAFTDKFFKLDTTESSVPPAIDCTTVAQMRDRITLEAIKQSNL